MSALPANVQAVQDQADAMRITARLIDEHLNESSELASATVFRLEELRERLARIADRFETNVSECVSQSVVSTLHEPPTGLGVAL